MTPRALLPLACLMSHLAATGAETSLTVADDLEPLLREHPGILRTVLTDPERYRFQLLIGTVAEAPGEPARLQRHGYRVDAEYFYPASAIKLCAAVAALEEVAELEAASGRSDLVHAAMEIAPLFPGDPIQREDPSHRDGGRITVAHEIRKLSLVSDNPAFNRLFDLVGHEALNRRMWALGLGSVVINHRLSEPRRIPDQNHTAAVTLLGTDGGTPVRIPERTSPLRLTNSAPGLRVGAARIEGDRRVEGAMDFTARNRISLVDLQNLLVRVVRPDIPLPGRPAALNPEHRRLLLDAMTRYPRESADPRYDAAKYPDAYSKFLLPGIRRRLPETAPGTRVEVTGKIGRAYGFTVENSCLHHPETGRTVFVTAVVYTNDDGVLNDDRYEYDTVADPLMADLGEWVARRWIAPR